MPTSTSPDLPLIAGLDNARVLQRLAYWLTYEMREYSEEWGAAIDILGCCRLAVFDTATSDTHLLDLQEIALATHVMNAYHRKGFRTQTCAGDLIGTQDGDSLYYLPALRQVVRTMARRAH